MSCWANSLLWASCQARHCKLAPSCIKLTSVLYCVLPNSSEMHLCYSAVTGVVPMTGGLLLYSVGGYAEDNRSKVSVFMNRSQVSSPQNNKALLSQGFWTLGAAGLHPQFLHIHHFCCSPRIWQGEQGTSLCSIHGQVGTKTPLQMSGNNTEAALN